MGTKTTKTTKKSKVKAEENHVAPEPTAPEPPPVVSSPATPEDSKLDAHEKAAEFLLAKCQEVQWPGSDGMVSWLPRTKTVSNESQAKMLASVGGRKRGFTLTKRLFSVAHPLIAEAEKRKRLLTSWRDAWTIVKSAESAKDDEGKTRIAKGVRIIRSEDIAEFDNGLRLRAEQVMTAIDNVQKYMDAPYTLNGKTYGSIKDMDREVLGDDYDARDYPADVRTIVTVRMPSYPEYRVSTRLPPEIYRREQLRLKEALSGTLESAVEYAATTFTTAFSTLAKQLVVRVRLDPLPGHRAVRPSGPEILMDAEVLSRIPEPDGRFKIEVRYKDKGTGKDDPERPPIIGPFTEEYYSTKLRPLTTDERKKLTKSVIDHMNEEMQNFRRLRDMLGDYGTSMDTALDAVRKMLTKAGQASEDVIKEIKGSNSYRKDLAETLASVTTELENTAVEVKEVRRKISAKYVGQF